ncbi:MAG: hypothetical protein M3P26_17225 [Gemmatimonadota bacterium]|nr:hypothetical protein [Gemmatimonadota bacterium]
MPNRMIKQATNVIRLRKLHNTVTDAIPQTATVTGTVLDPTGAPVSGATNLAMPFDAVLSEWRAIVPSTVGLASGPYKSRVIATLPDGSTRPFTDPFPVTE